MMELSVTPGAQVPLACEASEDPPAPHAASIVAAAITATATLVRKTRMSHLSIVVEYRPSPRGDDVQLPWNPETRQHRETSAAKPTARYSVTRPARQRRLVAVTLTREFAYCQSSEKIFRLLSTEA
ncbi:hypothetical protein FRAAL2994 [Frankia alni ACN14a]|uniref:Uncharacterized protein n=1 Tax=Frankia alni (strain DSM 45986 / CECT 9034 / ACN14a) TaxID=326424 RepID=Q0RLG6_FRAAA|nr:hypothetical protein FRAAL2994 [Frankia alni ACN14a]